MNTFQETIAEVLESLMPAYEKRDVYNHDHDLTEAQATLNKELRERLEKLKEVRPASGPNRNGTSECKRKAHNRAIDKVIQELTPLSG